MAKKKKKKKKKVIIFTSKRELRCHLLIFTSCAVCSTISSVVNGHCVNVFGVVAYVIDLKEEEIKSTDCE